MDIPSNPPPFRSRRRFPRVEVLGMVEGQRIPLDVPMKIRDLSQGGFSAESSVPFPPGTQHHFRFVALNHNEVRLQATAVHCRLASLDADGHYTYITGFEFQPDESSDKSIAAIIDTLTSVLALE
jgi:hypothetical protein